MHAFNLLSAAHSSMLGLSSGGGAVSVDFDGSVLIQFVAFLLLFIVIKPILLDPFLRVIEEREHRTDGAKAEARKMDEKAGEIVKRYETELEKVRRVANEERERLRDEARKLESEILGKARDETITVVEEGKAKIQKEADSIRFELGKASASIAADIASRVLGREVQ